MKLNWPPSVLSPNARAHWAAVGKAKKQYRADCYKLTKAAGVKKFPDGPLYLKITFYPPDNRKRDDDNMIAAFKAGRDGIAEAWGIDDSRFKPTYSFCDPIKGGAVKVEISGKENSWPQ